jgi:rhamnulokinase
MKTLNVLAMDYGASNGRGIIGKFDGSTLTIEEIHRFPNRAVSYSKGIYWDVLALFYELKNVLMKAKASSIPLSSIGIDTWGIDFGVLDAQGNLFGNPHSYRDCRTNEVIDEVFKAIPEYEIFSKTGMIPGAISSLFHIVSMKYKEKAFLEKGDTFLFMPNLLSYFLTGYRSCDSTQPSTSLLYSPVTKNWIREFPERLGIPNLFPRINDTGSIIGKVSDGIAQEIGIEKIPVVSVAGHDTASAIAAIPAENKSEIAYISCGTWSIVGTSLKQPLINRDVMEKNFCNEIGYDNEIMFVENITGFWILQECEREWAVEGYKTDYPYMMEYAARCSFNSSIDVDSAEFAQPGHMSSKVVEYCKRTGQRAPQNREEIFKCIVIGLAKKYKQTIEKLSGLVNKKFKKIHIIGGGSRNSYLCRLTAQLTGIEVVAGPCEATAIGNIVVQLIASGEVRNMKEAVQIIKTSFPLENF